MAKEKLRFTIAGKSVLYEGKHETRVKDLFDILVRMEVTQQVALQAYRDNIDGSESCTDENILQQFTDAQNAYEERKKRKELAGKTEPQEEKNGGAAKSEKTQKITLFFKGKQFSCDGAPGSKQDALIALLIKQNATHGEMVEAFRRNLPESTAGKEAILEMVAKAKEAKGAKTARKAVKKEQTTAAAEPESVESADNNNRDDNTSSSNSNKNNNNNKSNNNKSNKNKNTTNNNGQQEQQHEPEEKEVPQTGRVSTSGIEAIEEIAGMSVEERESISNFIRQVLDEKDVDASPHVPEDLNLYIPVSSIQRGGGGGGALSSVSALGGFGVFGDDDIMSSVTARSTRGKIPVYCQGKDTVVNKVIYISPCTSFEEFCAMVENKFGQKMFLSFYEGEDVIEMDGEDVFCMFLELNRAHLLEGKRLKLICSSSNSVKRILDDRLTDTHTDNDLRTRAFSAGHFDVCCEKTFTAHTSAVYCCCFSPKGDRFCTGSRDRSVRLWNTATGGCSVMKGGHNGFVLSCDFSPRGNRIVSSSDDRTIKVWNTATCTKVFTMKGHEDKVYCVQYNSTGDYIASASCDYTVKVWNAETGTRIVTLRGHTLGVFSCCFSNTDCGRYIVSCGDDRLIKVWEWAKGCEVSSMSGHTDTVWSCKFSHDDSRIVTASMNHEVKVWNWKSGACLLSWGGHQVPIHHAIFSNDDKYIYTCARDWTVMVWDAKTGELEEAIPGHRSTVYHMDISGNKLLTSSLDETLKLWSITPKR